MGTIEHIHIASEASKPMVPLLEAEVIAGRGIEGDRYASKTGTYSQRPTPGRHVTLIEAEVIDDVAQRLGIPLSPHETRRNVTTRGYRTRFIDRATHSGGRGRTGGNSILRSLPLFAKSLGSSGAATASRPGRCPL